MKHNTYSVVLGNGKEFKIYAFTIDVAYAKAIVYIDTNGYQSQIHHIIEGRDWDEIEDVDAYLH